MIVFSALLTLWAWSLCGLEVFKAQNQELIIAITVTFERGDANVSCEGFGVHWGRKLKFGVEAKRFVKPEEE